MILLLPSHEILCLDVVRSAVVLHDLQFADTASQLLLLLLLCQGLCVSITEVRVG